MITTQKKWIIFSSDFKPMSGGVAEFTFQIASVLHEKNLLKMLVTPVIQTQKYDFPVICPKIDYLSNKSFSLPIYFKEQLKRISIYIFLIKSFFIILQNSNNVLFFCYVDRFFALRMIRLCSFLGIDFSVLLHGKDILGISKQDPAFFDVIVAKSKNKVFNSHATEALFRKIVNGRELSLAFDTHICYPSIRLDYLDKIEPHKIEVLDNLPNNVCIISSVCRLVKRKGLHFAIQAFLDLDLDNKFQNVYYAIAGEGPERDFLETLTCNSRGKILFLGCITDHQKKSLLQMSKLFLMPNYSLGGSDIEGFGISFIEAAYFGNIVIGGNSGGVPEAIELCPGGIIVETSDENSVPNIRNSLEGALTDLVINSKNVCCVKNQDQMRGALDLNVSIDRLTSNFQ